MLGVAMTKNHINRYANINFKIIRLTCGYARIMELGGVIAISILDQKLSIPSFTPNYRVITDNIVKSNTASEKFISKKLKPNVSKNHHKYQILHDIILALKLCKSLLVFKFRFLENCFFSRKSTIFHKYVYGDTKMLKYQ